MIREPIVAGTFYESNKAKLKTQINRFLKTAKSSYSSIGVISPHAGYRFCGRAMAQVYKNLAQAETYILIGTSHRGYNISICSADWKTPLGVVESDKEFIERLDLEESNQAHFNEHSIEVQLPFLQIVNKSKFKIVPIVSSYLDFEACRELGSRIASIAKDSNKKICIIASSDFTHYGPTYGYVPFFENKKENMYKIDKEVIGLINSLDTKKFLDFIEGKTICGAYAIALTMEVVKALGCTKGILLDYFTSGDIINDYTNAVGYAAIVFL